ncbi:right-handed parallel beta-helix repeat-containing protein [Ancylobacter sonchi]|uniref:right-handed parallel beta-helix repeat-containing protein n=1 Tax=Ancylobacter sonchi TaxID=1937790 RepID=UPI001BD2875C|nr:right-handed parallel beta-helix repeat-containing protein [Ancylobacter sonchi]MBS7536734.1 right-handed parallel beta-helix repeat-containing protein [Ancylobacter sonchi]
MPTTTYFPALENISAPQFVRVDGYATPGDGGEALYERQDIPVPSEGPELFPDGFTDWDLGEWVRGPGDRLGPGVSTDTKYAIGTFPITPGRRYRVRWNVAGRTSGTWSVSVLSVLGYGARTFFASSSSNGDGELIFEARPGNTQFRFNGTAAFDGSIGLVSLVELRDEGQQTLLGASYLPVPLDGVLRPEMFGAGFGGNDDAAFRRFFQRINTLALERQSVHLEINGRYNCVETRHLVCVPAGVNVTIDGDGGVVNLTGSDPSAESFWLEFLGPGYDGLDTEGRVKTTLKAGIAAGAENLSVFDNTGFEDGDWIALTSTWEYWGGVGEADGFQRLNTGELIQIRYRSTTTDDALVLGAGTAFAYAQNADPSTYPINVRRFLMAGQFSLRGLRAIGPGSASTVNRQGTAFLNVRHFAEAQESFVTLENFPGYSLRYTLCAAISMDTPKTVGRRFDRSNNNSNWYYGREVMGCARASIVSPIGEHCRRSIDLHEASQNSFVGDRASSQEGVVSKQIAMVGGYSVECRTLPGGHLSYDVTLTGHTGHDSGGQMRGKNIRWVNVHTNSGLSLGGEIGSTDPATYASENPSQGHVELVGCSFRNLHDGGWGIQVRQNVDSLRIQNCVVVAQTPIAFYGRNQDNVVIEHNYIAGRDGVPPTQPIIAFLNNGDTAANKESSYNITVRSNHLKNGTYAFHHSGVKVSEARDIHVDDNIFENITAAHMRLLRNTGSQWATDGSITLIGNEQRAPFPSSPADVSTLAVVRHGNNFNNAPVILSVSGMTLEIPKCRASTLYVQLPNTSATVATLAGLQEGQFLCVVKAGGSNPVTFQHGTGNLQLGSDRVLNSGVDRIVLVGTATGGACLVSFADNS